MERIRVLIADDHQMVRDGFRRLLEREPDLLVVGEAGGVSETLEQIRQTQPDVVLLDMHLTDGTGREVLPALPQMPAPTRAIVVTGVPHDGTAEEVIGLGASGYLVKSASSAELVRAIRAVHRGEIWADHSSLSRLVEHLRHAPAAAAAPPAGARAAVSGAPRALLSGREREILQSVGEGFNNSEIAARLFISENTVKAHLSRIFQKLMVQDRTQAVVIGLQRGLISAHKDDGARS
jgi:DNA-binding NarL/FixJ family response regulator